jgi:hypothetical protein
MSRLAAPTQYRSSPGGAWQHHAEQKTQPVTVAVVSNTTSACAKIVPSSLQLGTTENIYTNPALHAGSSRRKCDLVRCCGPHPHGEIQMGSVGSVALDRQGWWCTGKNRKVVAIGRSQSETNPVALFEQVRDGQKI